MRLNNILVKNILAFIISFACASILGIVLFFVLAYIGNFFIGDIPTATKSGLSLSHIAALLAPLASGLITIALIKKFLLTDASFVVGIFSYLITYYLLLVLLLRHVYSGQGDTDFSQFLYYAVLFIPLVLMQLFPHVSLERSSNVK